MVSHLIRRYGTAIALGSVWLNLPAYAFPTHGSVSHTRYVDMRSHGTNSFGYVPRTITVRAGTRVVWRNRSSQPHSVTPTGRQQAFDQTAAKQIDPRHQWSFVFKNAGTYRYYCIFHPYMHGVIRVVR